MIIKVRPATGDRDSWLRQIAEAELANEKFKRERAKRRYMEEQRENAKLAQLANLSAISRWFKRFFCKHKYEAFGGGAIPDFRCNKCHKVTGLSLF